MMAGLPVVATRVGDLERVVGPEVGRLAPAGQPQALAEAMTTLLDDPAGRFRMGAAAQAQARREYSAEIWMGRLAALYVQAAARPIPVGQPGSFGKAREGDR